MAERLTSLKSEAAKTLGGLQKEIAHREKELAEMHEEASICRQLLGKPDPAGSGRGGMGKKRIDWVSVLRALPREFTARDVIAKINKPPAAVYTQLYQMTKANRLKRTKDGYVKI
jgi:hypothetical protein